MNEPERDDKRHRWLPKHGVPQGKLEGTAQQIVKITAYLPIYISIITTLTLLFIIFGVPFIGGK